jgi:uncharacterized protein (TIGR02996 family)
MADDTGYALRWAILEDPIDDAPRLIYADWLDETGDEWDARLAEVIRLEVWLARADRRRWAGHWSAADPPEYDRHLLRLADLWWNHSYQWFRDTHRDDVDRGFIRTLRTSKMTFFDRETASFTRDPITVVEFDDVWYERGEEGFVVVVSPHWRQDEPDYASAAWPLELFPGQDGRTFRFETTAEADAVLSDAAVAYGRRLAGLPELRLPYQL